MSFNELIEKVEKAVNAEEKAIYSHMAILEVMNAAMNIPGRGGCPWILDVLEGHVGETSHGSVFTHPSELEAVFEFVVDTEKEWDLMSATNGVAIFRYSQDDKLGETKAVLLEAVDPNTPVKVVSLGDHPTLTPVDPDKFISPAEGFMGVGNTNAMTAIVEYEGAEYEKDVEYLKWTHGEPLLATIFPGEALPPSRPHDCSEGDCMTAETALEKGWKVLKLK